MVLELRAKFHADAFGVFAPWCVDPYSMERSARSACDRCCRLGLSIPRPSARDSEPSAVRMLGLAKTDNELKRTGQLDKVIGALVPGARTATSPSILSFDPPR